VSGVDRDPYFRWNINSLGGPAKTVTVEENKYDGNKVVSVTTTSRHWAESPKARIDYRGSGGRLRSLLYQRFR